MSTEKGRGRKTDTSRRQGSGAQGQVLDLGETTAVASTTTHSFLHAKKTTNLYSSYVQRGEDFLKNLAKNNLLPVEPPEYDKAFSKPIEASPVALLQFLVNYMSKRDYRYSSAEGIRSAFKDHFQKLGCQGNYWRENGKGGYEGNPVFDLEFSQYIKSLKNKEEREGTRNPRNPRSQSLAMSYSDMSLLMANLQHPETRSKYGDLCIMFEAFAATAFTIWTRIDELVKLRGADVVWDQVSETGRPYFIITLTYRKTNQTDEGNAYHIYPTPHEPDTCCYTKLLAWKALLELKTRNLQSDDFIFPNVDGKGVPKVLEELTQPRVQGFLDTFTKSTAGARKGKFTTHCFRRGGAQHRFMFAREKWSLKAIKWWGGWSADERTGTIMRYLLDESVRYVTGYSDMLAPDRDDSRHALFMGERESSGQVDTPRSLEAELTSIKNAIMDALDHKLALLKLELTHQGQQIVSRVGTVITKQFTAEMIGNLGSRSTTTVCTSDQPLGPRHELCDQGEQCHPEHAIIIPPTAAVSSDSVFPHERPVAPKIPDAKDWVDCVNQWRYGDPDKNLNVPLADWNPAMRKTAPAMYSNRKLIADEFQRLNYSEKSMESEHGSALRTIKALMISIRKKAKARETNEQEDKEQGKKQKQKEVSVVATINSDTDFLIPAVTQVPTVAHVPKVIQQPAVALEQEEEDDEPPLIRGRTKEQYDTGMEEEETEQARENEEGREKENKTRTSSTRRRQASSQKPSNSPRRSKRVKL
ncbi:hypothetical protein BGZ83_003167 [Gryganskiella cystojenkinii]|nr:hypothetical protein BGZ83_003167 [Gryganskiella cystojenkinii]